MKRLLPVAVLLAAVFSNCADACSCRPKKPVPLALASSSTVFEGTVINFSRGLRYREATFEVTAVWKGRVTRTTDVLTGLGGGDCGYFFKEGSSYIVYAWTMKDATLRTSICRRTRVADGSPESVAELAALGASRAPIADAPADYRWLVAGVTLLVLVASVLVLATRKRSVDDEDQGEEA